MANLCFFTEINASGAQGTSSSFGTARPEDLSHVEKYPQDGPHHKTVYIENQEIKLWLDNSRRNVVEAWYELHCYISKPNY